MAEYMMRYVQLLLTKETAGGIAKFTKEHKWAILGAGFAGYALLRLLRRPRNLPPGPVGYTLLSSEMHLDLDRLGKKYGDIYSMNVPGFGRVVILNSQKMIKDAYINHGDDFAHRSHSTLLDAIGLSDDLFAGSYTEEFKTHKRFVLKNLKNYGFGTAAGEKKILVQIAAMTDFLREKSNTEIDAKNLFYPVATNVIGSIIYNEQLHLDDTELARIYDMVEIWITEVFSETAFIFDLLPKWTYPIIMRDRWKNIVNSTEGIIDLLQGKLESHVKSLDVKNPRDFIDGYLMDTSRDFNPRIMAYSMMLFLPDAIFSVSTILRYMFFFVAKYPEFQSKLQKQIDKVVGRSRQITVSDKSQLPLVEALFLESSRVAPLTVVAPPRTAQKDLDFAGYNIPKGSCIMANFYGVHFNETIYPEPEKFKPERYIDDQGHIKRTDAWYLFGIGRRSCIGEHLAKMEIYLLAANLLQQFTFSFAEDFVPYDDVEVRKTYKDLPYPKLIITER